jgi:hypothetical protein
MLVTVQSSGWIFGQAHAARRLEMNAGMVVVYTSSSTLLLPYEPGTLSLEIHPSPGAALRVVADDALVLRLESAAAIKSWKDGKLSLSSPQHSLFEARASKSIIIFEASEQEA